MSIPTTSHLPFHFSSATVATPSAAATASLLVNFSSSASYAAASLLGDAMPLQHLSNGASSSSSLEIGAMPARNVLTESTRDIQRLSRMKLDVEFPIACEQLKVGANDPVAKVSFCVFAPRHLLLHFSRYND